MKYLNLLLLVFIVSCSHNSNEKKSSVSHDEQDIPKAKKKFMKNPEPYDGGGYGTCIDEMVNESCRIREKN